VGIGRGTTRWHSSRRWGWLISGTSSSTGIVSSFTCHLPLFYNGPLRKACQRHLPTSQGSAQGTWSAISARVRTATAGKRMEALRATAPRATMETLTSPMDAKVVTTDFTLLSHPYVSIQ